MLNSAPTQQAPEPRQRHREQRHSSNSLYSHILERGIKRRNQVGGDCMAFNNNWRVPLENNPKELEARPYCCSFSEDGSYYYYATQDHKVTFKKYGTDQDLLQFNATVGQWTITDYALSSSTNQIAYTSLVPYVHLASINKTPTGGLEQGSQKVLDFSTQNHSDFGLFCVRFSSDGKELLAGSNSDSLFCYDIERETLVNRIEGHDNDVNSVCFVDSLSSNVIVSGSDDNLIKVWDRRSLKRNGQPAGTLIGHTEGITYITSKGDGRSLLSNSKDQQLKLWDLRKSLTSNLTPSTPHDRVSTLRWDYRWQPYPLPTPRSHPLDTSVQTFTGHQVLRTLIRAHFSPLRTGSRWIYSASSDGIVHVWDTLTTHHTRIDMGGGCVRDVAWHPFDALMIAGRWNDGDGLRGGWRGGGGSLVKAELDYYGESSAL